MLCTADANAFHFIANYRILYLLDGTYLLDETPCVTHFSRFAVTDMNILQSGFT